MSRYHSRRVRLWLGPMVVVLAVGACGDDDEVSSGDQPTDETSSTTYSGDPVHDVPESAPWELSDPGSVGPDTVSLHVVVQEFNCTSGNRADGRIAPPEITESPDAIVITIGIHQLLGPQSCQDVPPTPFDVELPSPVGDRQLLDGSVDPPAVRYPDGVPVSIPTDS